MAFGGLFRTVASRILDIDDTSVPYEQLEILNDFLSKHQFNVSGKDSSRLLNVLKKKHMVDSITVVNHDGGLVVSSEGNGVSEGQLAKTLLSYVDSEFSTPESLLIKGANNWFMVFPFNEKTFVVKAPSSLSNVELRALAKEVESVVSGDK